MAEELKKTKAPLSVGLLAHVDAGAREEKADFLEWGCWLV